MHAGPNNLDAWLLLGSLASFHFKFTALLQSVLTAVQQRKQNAKVILHLHKWNAEIPFIPTQGISTIVSHLPRCEIIDLVHTVI